MKRRSKSSERLRIAGGLARRWTLVVSFGLMAVFVGVFALKSVRPIRADYALNPAWTPPPSVGDSFWYIGPWAKPVQNASDSRLYVYVDADPGADRYLRVFRVRDDGTATLGNKLSPNLNVGSNEGNVVGFASDGLDGAYVGWTQVDIGTGYNNHFARVGSNGNPIWQFAPNDAIGVSIVNWGQYMDLASDGHLLFAYLAGNVGNYRVCGMKLNQASGAKMWGTTPICTIGTRAARELWSGNIIPRGLASDGAGGMVILAQDGASTMKARRILNNGTANWTVDVAATRQPLSAVYQDGAVYVLSSGGGATIYLDRINVSDGSRPWPSSLQVGTAVGSTGKFAVTGDMQLAVAWRRSSDSALMLNLIDGATGEKIWASDRLVDTDASDGYSIVDGNQATVYVGYCFNWQATSSDCSVQGFDQFGNPFFGSEGAALHKSRFDYEMALGVHLKESGSLTQVCLDQAFHEFGSSVGAQMYCLGSPPTVTEPVCSLDDGQSFTLCSDAQIGTTVSHVQADCEPGGEAPFAEGRLAGEAVHEEKPRIEGRYVGYERSVGDGAEIYYYDLGPDELFGTADDGRVRVTDNIDQDRLEDIDAGRLLYLFSDSPPFDLHIYNIAAGSVDPGTISVTDAALGGNYLVYDEGMGNQNYRARNIGPDGRLGTADDVAWYDFGVPDAYRYLKDIAGKYALFVFDDLDEISHIVLVDLVTKQQFTVSNPAEETWADPSFDGRYVVWTDWRNDPNGQYNNPPPLNNADIFIYDLGPDGTYGTADDIPERQVSTSSKNEYSPSVRDNRITWSRAINECSGCGWDYNSDIFMISFGPDGEFGTADDVGPVQMTDEIHAQQSPKLSGENLVWIDNRENLFNDDIYITPVGGAAATVDEVRFTMTSPSGDEYADQVATIVNGSTYALNYPVLIDEEGTWRVSATCFDQAGQPALNEVEWNVAPWPFSDSQKLSVYDGVTQISRSSGDTLEIGNAGRDIASTGSIYLRPNTSYAGLSWEGVPGIASQRLHLPLGINGQPAVLAEGTGTLDSPNGANAVAGFFDGAGKDAGGSAVGGSVLSCDEAGGCAAGRFAGGSEVGLHAESLDASFPALRAENASDGTSASNTSGRFEGKVNVTGNLEAVPVSFPSCTWVDVSQGDTVCPNNGFVAGFDKRDVNQLDLIYCCGN